MGQETGNEIEIEDAYLASAFLVQHPALIEEVSPFLKSINPPRVSFRIKGQIQAAISQINNNEKVGILDFIQAAKRLRNSIFLLKGTVR